MVLVFVLEMTTSSAEHSAGGLSDVSATVNVESGDGAAQIRKASISTDL